MVSWARALEGSETSSPTLDPYTRGLQRVTAGMALLYGTWLVPHAFQAEHVNPVDLVLIAFALAAHAVVAGRGFRVRMDERDVALVAVAALAMIAIDVGTDATGVGIQASAAYPSVLLTLVLGGVLLTPRRQWLLVVPAVGAMYAIGRGLTIGADGFWTALDELSVDLGGVAVVGYTVSLFRRAGRRALEALRIATLADPQQRAAEAQEAESSERLRVLHDEVIGSLVAIQHTNDPVVAREAALRASNVLAQPLTDEHTSIDDLVLTHTPLHLDVDDAVTDRSIPSAVRRAMTAAGAEAVRNADRHAGASRITVRARSSRSGAVVRITDDGSGFDASSITSGFGIRHSIQERMNEIGGHAEIRSTPGSGTEVELTWTPSGARRWSALDDAMSARFALTVTGLAAAGLLWLVPRHVSWSVELPVLLTSVGLVGAVAAVTALRSLTRPLVLVIGAALCLLTWWGLGVAGPGATADFGSWVVSVACVSLFTLACFVPTLDLLLLGTALSATTLLWTWQDGTPLAEAQDPISQPLVLAIALGASAAALRWARAGAARAELDLVDSLRRDAVRASRTRSIPGREASLRRDLTPFLTGIADGSILLGDPDVAARAHHLAVQVRDEIQLAGVLDDELRDLISTAREAGLSVTFRTSGDVAPSPALAPLLRRVIDPAVHQQITLSLPEDGRPYTRLVVVPGLRSIDEQVVSELDVDHSPEATVITIAETTARTQSSR